MTKFEEELRKIKPHKKLLEFNVGVTYWYCLSALVQKFGNWHSDEEFQEKATKLTFAEEEIEELGDKISQLKSQLKQQALPVVPECVGELIKHAKDNNKTIRWCLYGNCKELYPQAAEWIGADDDIEFTDKTYKQQELFVRAWLDGFTVEKTKLFYLKNKLTGFYLFKAFGGKYGEEFNRSTINLTDDFKFTQPEIDSMQTGSYEQIEVEK